VGHSLLTVPVSDNRLSAFKAGSMTDFTGNWILEKCDNMEAFVAKDGMSWPKRKVASAMGFGVGKHKVDITMSPGGPTMDVQETTPFGQTDNKLALDGKPQDLVVMSGDTTATMATSWEGAELVHVVVTKNGETTVTMRRKLEGGQMVVSLTNDGVTATRFFKKQ